MGMITKQPNGLYARISPITDSPTHTNMSEQNLYDYLKDTNQLHSPDQTVEEWMAKWGEPFEDAVRRVTNFNMSQEEIDAWLDKVEGSADVEMELN